SFGWHIAIGVFIFGIGMVIAGGCASGILMRIGEGHALPWIVFIGMIIGNLLGAKDYSFWYDKIIKNSKVIYFPEYMDIRIAIVVQIIILIIIYKFLSFREKRNFEKK
ncbi:transporter, partial [Clostridium botulinum]|nr:transporter [Clostridium botulinum]